MRPIGDKTTTAAVEQHAHRPHAAPPPSLNRLQGVIGQYSATLRSQAEARPHADLVLWSARYFEQASGKMKYGRLSSVASASSGSSSGDMVGLPLLPEHIKLLIDQYGTPANGARPSVSESQLRAFFADNRIAAITLQRLLALGCWPRHRRHAISVDEFVALACALYTTSRRRTVAAAARLLSASSGASALSAGRVLAIDTFLHGLETAARSYAGRNGGQGRAASADGRGVKQAPPPRSSVAHTVRSIASEREDGLVAISELVDKLSPTPPLYPPRRRVNLIHDVLFG